MTTRQDRVENALQQLLERLVPTYEGEDETLADRRWDEANELARALLSRHLEPSVTEDVNHAADSIKRRFIRDQSSPEKATLFSNLYSRLLSQPVLSQKWGILYFLLKLADGGRANGSLQGNLHAQDRLDEMERESPRKRHVAPESPSFSDAFARNGLPVLPTAGDVNSVRSSLVRDRPHVYGRPRTQADETPPQSPHVALDEASRPPEAVLLRDLPFTLQGLSSSSLPFSSKDSLQIPPGLPVPMISLLYTLAEPSLLYRSLAEFVESSDGGLVGQSLRSAVGVEMRSYLSLVATLEGQIRRALTQLGGEAPNGGLRKVGVTLKRCVVWTRDATLGLRLMSMIVESSKGKKGGELVSLIHGYAASHGDPFVHSFAERLLTTITRPFYGMLRAWIYEGELEDPYLEFFVHENRDHEDSGATSVWEHKYQLNTAMIPSIIDQDLANRVFLIGKSLNFIRYSCSDSAWVESYSKDASTALRYGDTATLSRSIGEAYKTVMARLMNLMETKFALFEHLQALKSYLLLGQGDFIALLMESLATNLDRPANSQYRHTLTAQLEHAIRNSNAQFDSPDVLRRLDARMLELSHGEIGWDVFTLEYRVDSPLDVIVTPWASKQYLKVFNFLWRVKRVEFALGSTWRRCMTGARGVLAAVDGKVGADWKLARGGIAEMVHFVDQLQYFILFEVIEAGWEGLQKAMRKPDATLDTLISAHTTYLRSITRKGLLGGGSIDFTAQLHELLKLMLAYRDAVDSLYSYSLAEFTKKQELAAKIETRTKAGKWGLSEADAASSQHSLVSDARGSSGSPLPPPLLSFSGVAGSEDGRNIIEQLRQRLKSVRTDFKARVNVLLGDLAYQPDTDMRFLGVVMNFNDVYQPVKRRRQGHATGTKEKGTSGSGGTLNMGKGD